MNAWTPETLAEKRLNRRAALLAGVMLRDAQPSTRQQAYANTLKVARMVVDTIVELETERGGSATWVGQA